MFHVKGGIFTDMSFTKLEPGQKPVELGPYRSYDEAHVVWRDVASRTIDICTAKYWIVETEEAVAG